MNESVPIPPTLTNLLSSLTGHLSPARQGDGGIAGVVATAINKLNEL